MSDAAIGRGSFGRAENRGSQVCQTNDLLAVRYMWMKTRSNGFSERVLLVTSASKSL